MGASQFRVGDMVLDTSAGHLRNGVGELVKLRHQAAEVLRLLAETPGEMVARDAFLDRIWQGRQGGDEGLAQCIAELRRVLRDRDRTIIETIPRQGYRLIVDASPEPVGARQDRWWIATLALSLVLLGAVSLWFLQPGSSTATRPVIAVLPFEDLGSSGEAQILGDSVSEDIINSLARYSEFDVIARHSSFRFRDTPGDLSEVAAQLSADYLVQGSQVLRDRTLRMSVQLIDVRDQTNIWVDQFEVPVTEMFEVNDTIAYRIAHAISSSVVAITAATARPDGQVDALILDNRARVLFQSAPRRDSWVAALALTQQSLDDFPASEWGHLGRALLLRVGVRFGWSDGSTEALLDEAERHARRAVELGPQNYMTHLALGRVLMQRGEIDRSAAALEAAVELNPSSIIVLNALAQAYIYSDQLNAAERVLTRIARIDPIQDSVSQWMHAWAAWQEGACEEAFDIMRAMPMIPPEAMKLVAVIHVCRGDLEAARTAGEAFLDAYPDWTLARESETNARNWTNEAPRERWLSALALVGFPD